MRHWYMRLLSLAVAGAFVVTALGAAQAEGWGTIKGQVVWGGDKAPKRPAINPDKDKAACTKNGPLFGDKLVVNDKNKGVRWCLVYLMSVDGFKKDIPIKPALKKLKSKTVELDQPCCQFEPHIVAMRQGQTLVVKNSADVAHNVNISSIKGPNVNQIVPPGGKFVIEDITAQALPMSVKCDIHSWMSGRVAILKNPYFAVTDKDGNFEIKDAPAGEFRLVVWHEEVGWVAGDTKPSRNGKKITIKDKETTDLGKITIKPEKKD